MSPLAWIWWQTDPTRWHLGTPEKESDKQNKGLKDKLLKPKRKERKSSSETRHTTQRRRESDHVITSPKQLQALVKCVTAAIKWANSFSEHIHYSEVRIQIPRWKNFNRRHNCCSCPQTQMWLRILKGDIVTQCASEVTLHSSLSKLAMTSLYWKSIMGLAVQSTDRPQLLTSDCTIL